MITYYALLRGEDGMEFCIDHECNTQNEMESHVDLLYPEATILNIQSDWQRREDEAERYNRLADEMDSGIYEE